MTAEQPTQTNKKPWHTVQPADAVNIQLPHPDIQGPYTQEGEECPWPWDPIQLKGAPMGMYHCPYCGEMCLAGMEHPDYGPIGPDGMNQMDRDYDEYCKAEKAKERSNGDSVDRWEGEGGVAF